MNRAKSTVLISAVLTLIIGCSKAEPGCDPRKMRSFIECAQAKKTEGYSADSMTSFMETNGFHKMPVYQNNSRWLKRDANDMANTSTIAVIDVSPNGQIKALTFK